jgi:kynurenine formamidase
VIARGVLLDVAGTQGVDALPDAYAITPRDLQDTVAKQGVELRKGDVVLVRTGRMNAWPDFDGYLKNTPGIGLPAAKWLCEEAGAMCIAGDTIGLEVLPSEEENVFLPVHAYMFATAGAQIIEVVDMNEIAAEKQYEFAFLGLPLKLRGATGAPMPSYAVPLRS